MIALGAVLLSGGWLLPLAVIGAVKWVLFR